ncbi:hypothetical protein C2E23DRAFT_417948 [Lenzites betulinus]|nr:hypothetical protein C2E23DRAFT_417948 [Lenzites betulinus]
MEGVHLHWLHVNEKPLTALPRAPKKPRGRVYARAGSCAGCQENRTCLFGQQTRCDHCELTRYCSLECQREDWRRHKETCDRIRCVSFDVREGHIEKETAVPGPSSSTTDPPTS